MTEQSRTDQDLVREVLDNFPNGHGGAILALSQKYATAWMEDVPPAGETYFEQEFRKMFPVIPEGETEDEARADFATTLRGGQARELDAVQAVLDDWRSLEAEMKDTHDGRLALREVHRRYPILKSQRQAYEIYRGDGRRRSAQA